MPFLPVQSVKAGAVAIVRNAAKLSQRRDTNEPLLYRRTLCGSRVFQAFSAIRTFLTASSYVNGGTGGLVSDDVFVVLMLLLIKVVEVEL